MRLFVFLEAWVQLVGRREPGPRAHHIHPAPFGETYQYIVEKYWTVRGRASDGTLELEGKILLQKNFGPIIVAWLVFF